VRGAGRGNFRPLGGERAVDVGGEGHHQLLSPPSSSLPLTPHALNVGLKKKFAFSMIINYDDINYVLDPKVGAGTRIPVPVPNSIIDTGILILGRHKPQVSQSALKRPYISGLHSVLQNLYRYLVDRLRTPKRPLFYFLQVHIFN
jgi:hypothetical protein